MVDPERLHRVLRRIADGVAVLRGYRVRGASALLADPAALGHCKYAFVTALEGVIDAAQHVLASEGWGPPDNDADAVAILARHGVLDEDLAARLGKAVGFRNVLVHGYASVDDRRVVAHLDELADLDAFIDALAVLTEPPHA